MEIFWEPCQVIERWIARPGMSMVSSADSVLISSLLMTKATPAELLEQVGSGEFSVTVHILSHHIYLFSFLCRTHLLWGLYSYDWYHCMYLVGSTSFSLFLL
jgi:hypothetical protein